MPWDNNLFSCQIFLPKYSTLSFNKKTFAIFENRFQDKYKIRIIINFQGSTFIVQDAIAFYFGGINSMNVVDLSFRCVRFEKDYNSTFDNAGLLIKNLNKIEFRNCSFDRTYLDIRESNQVVVSSSFVRDLDNKHAFKFIQIKNVSVLNTTFTNNNGGGAMFVHKCEVLSVIFSRFMRNTALFGSALYLNKVNVANIMHNQFFTNVANHAGGALYWIFEYMSPPIMNDNIWRENTARYYGNDYSSSFCGNQCLQVSPSIINVTDYTNISLPSNVYVSVVDFYGSVMKSYNNNQVKAIAKKEKSYCKGVIGDETIGHDALVVNKSNSKRKFIAFDLKDGESVLSDVGVICLPSGKMSITIEVNLDVPSGLLNAKNNLVSEYLATFDRELIILFRSCKKGEKFDLVSITQSTCSLCAPGFYSFEENIDFQSVATECHTCPANALKCFGDQILLREGTWRRDINSLDIYPCQSTEACKGGNLTGAASCRVGHAGTLCGICEKNYFLTKDKVCESCDMRATPILQSVGCIVVLFGIIGIAYWKFRKIVDEYFLNDFTQAVLSKLLTSYQIILLGLGKSSTFRSFKLYSQLIGFFSFINLDIGSLFSLGCGNGYNFYSSLQLYILAPAAIGLVIVCKVMLSKTINEKIAYFSLLVSVMFFVIPLVTSISLQTYECIQVDSELLLVADLTLACTGDLYENYKRWAMIGFFTYMLFFPLFTFNILYFRRDLIAHANVIEKFRQLHNYRALNNLRISNYYALLPPFEGLYARFKPKYWWYDIFNLYTNIILTSIIQSSFHEESFRLLVSILVIIFCYVLEGRCRPYKNELENVISYNSTFQLLLLYVSMYVKMFRTLGPRARHYEYLDRFVVLLQVFTIFLYIRCLVVYFKEKYIFEAKRLANININDEDDRVAEQRYQNIRRFYRRNAIVDVTDKTPLKVLLRLQGIMFLRLCPLGVYQSLRMKYSDTGNIMSELYYERRLPTSFIYYNEYIDRIVGDISVFSMGRSNGRARTLLKPSLSSWMINLSLLFDVYNVKQRELKMQFSRRNEEEKKKKEKEDEEEENIVENLEIVVVKDDGNGVGDDISEVDEAFIDKEFKICMGYSSSSNSNEGDSCRKEEEKKKKEEIMVENLEIAVVKDDGFGGDISGADEAFVDKELKICIGHSNASNSNLRSSNKEENKKEEEKEERRIEIVVVTKDHNYKDIRSHVDEAFNEQDFVYTDKRGINANSNDDNYNALFHPNLSSSESHDDVGNDADIFELSSSGGSNISFSKAGVKEIEVNHSDRHSNNHCTSQIKHSKEKTVIHRRGDINRAAAAAADDDDNNNNNNNNNNNDEQYDGDNENNHIV